MGDCHVVSRAGSFLLAMTYKLIMKPFTFKIGGPAGYGIMSAGLAFSKLAVRSGYYIFDYTEYPSVIRGGHNVMQTTVSDEPVASQYLPTNFLVALNQETIDRHAGELMAGSGLIYDKDGDINVLKVPDGVHLFAIPLNKIAKEATGNLIIRNTAALGAALALLGGNLQILAQILSEEFAKKSLEIVKQNQTAMRAGYNYVLENYPNNILKIIAPRKKHNQPLVINGNEAVALGAIAAGLQFAAIYPMTPITNILHILAKFQEQYQYIYKQPEDEISAINMAIGASFAGARSLTATAGGGFCLMTEGYGLAAMTETPLVVVVGMRPGPATSMPTWTGQGDLQFVLHSHQDDLPRFVLAPGDVEEAFHLTMEAFNLGDQYQTPIIILIDKNLCESHQSVAEFNYEQFKVKRGKLLLKFDPNFLRYKLSADGVSTRSIPGVNYFVANSDEHDEQGYSDEESDNRNAQMKKRMTKLLTGAQKDLPEPKLYGPQTAELTLVSWGSNKGAILEALKQFKNVNYLHLTWINPFPIEAVTKILKAAKKIINIEGNYSAQLGGWIAEQTGIKIKNNLLKFDGRPFYPEEIIAKIKQTLKK